MVHPDHVPVTPEKLREDVRSVWWWQVGITLLVAVGGTVVRGPEVFFPALYGGFVAVVLSGWLGRGVLRSTRWVSLYANAVTRYGLAIILLGIGLGVLKLLPLPLLAAYALAQFGYLALWTRHRA